MGVFSIGNQRVGIVTPSDVRIPPYNEPDPDAPPTVEWVRGCSFQIQNPTEQQGDTVTTSEMANAYLPVRNGCVRVVDVDGAFVRSKPVTEITANVALRDGDTGLDYEMRGNALLQRDIDGREDHVFCIAERETP